MDLDQQLLMAQLEEDGLLKVRRDFESGVYGKNSSSLEWRLVDAWLEKQHRERLQNMQTLKQDPLRLLQMLVLVGCFVALLLYIFLG
jgi:hypothetical protein